LADEV